MKGLLLNNFYSMQESMKLSAVIVVFLGIAFLLIGDAISVMAIATTIFMSPLNIGSSLQTDEASKWNKFEITVPVRRRTIIVCKYLSYLVMVFIGLLSSFAIIGLAALLGRGIGMPTILLSCFFGLSLIMLTGSFMYPLLLIFGAARSELIIVLSVIIAMGGAVLLMTFFGIASVIAPVVCFVISCFVSIYIHGKKEF